MYKYIYLLFIIIYLFSNIYSENKDKQYSVMIDMYNKFSSKKLIKTADEFLEKNQNDSALMYYSMIYNNRSIKNDTILVKSLNKAAVIYYNLCDYKTSLDLLLKALKISEDIKYDEYTSRINVNIGNIYYSFKEYRTASNYYKKAYNEVRSNSLKTSVLINLGAVACDNSLYDSAMCLYRKAYEMQKGTNDPASYDISNNVAYTYLKLKQYDSTLYYYRKAIENAKKLKATGKEAKILSNIGILYCDKKNYDSAKYYLNKSILLSEESARIDVLSHNYLYLSQIEEIRGNKSLALHYYKQYSIMNDSIFNAQKYGDINKLQFLYEITKIDKQIQELNDKQEIKEHIIHLQKTRQIIMLSGLLILIAILIFIYIQKKRLHKSYKILAEKNIELVNQEKVNQELIEKYQQPNETVKFVGNLQNDQYKAELANAILNVMKDKTVFCDPEFSINSLAEKINSNYGYVSKIINNVFKTDFRHFINQYRIKESQKILSAEHQKYSIESISMMVGFKSKSSFNIAFKDITGVTPSLYIKSLKITPSQQN